MATSAPVPMAIPRSACASAGASLMPSPTIATTAPPAWSSATSAALSPGSTSARIAIRTDADLGADRRPPSRRRSPVIIHTSSPARSRAGRRPRPASGFTVSARPMTPSSSAVARDADRRAGSERPRVELGLGHAGLAQEARRARPGPSRRPPWRARRDPATASKALASGAARRRPPSAWRTIARPADARCRARRRPPVAGARVSRDARQRAARRATAGSPRVMRAGLVEHDDGDAPARARAPRRRG